MCGSPFTHFELVTGYYLHQFLYMCDSFLVARGHDYDMLLLASSHACAVLVTVLAKMLLSSGRFFISSQSLRIRL